MATTGYFNRRELAGRFADSVLQTTPTSAVGSGLFLAAPRRTGKSTFVREDLRPELSSRGALVVYVDLWADRLADPGDVLVGAVRAELARHDGVLLRMAKAAGMDKVTVGGLGCSLDRVGIGGDVSLSSALAALSDEVRQPIVLIVDEAQHAITTDKGFNALFAVKAARDELNSSAHHGLRIIATGSNRDKLAMLKNSKEQAFYKAPLVTFPHLDIDYVKWFCEGVGLAAPLVEADVMRLFERAGFRPEILGAAADQVRLDFGIRPADIPDRFGEAVETEIRSDRDSLLKVVHGLTSLQSAVFRVMAAHGARYAPFEPATVEAYRRVLAAIDPRHKSRFDATTVQSALQALQDKSLIWRERRGIYALEDGTTGDVLKEEGWLIAVPALPDRQAS